MSWTRVGAVLPAVLACCAGRFDALAMVKPQFEVGRERVGKGGVVRSADDRRAFEKNRQAFLEKLNREMERWNKVLEPVRGAKVVAYHPDVIYFLTRFGLVQVGTLEDRPGIPPSPQHLVQIIRQMKAEGVKVILVEPWNDFKLAQRVAEEAGAKAYVFASAVGGVKGTDNYIATIEFNVTLLAQALK